MKKRIFLSVLSLALIFQPFLVRADFSNSVIYLQGQGQDHWISQALIAVGQSNIDLSYLSGSTTNVMTAAKNLLVAAASQENELADLATWQDTVSNAFDNEQIGSTQLLNDDFWSTLALAAVNKSDHQNIINSDANFIISQQNNDGGWSWSISGDSDSNDTAAAIMALLEAGYNSQSPALVNAINYLHNIQKDDGGFPYQVGSESDGASTAWVLAALNKLGQSSGEWVKNQNTPSLYLESLALSDGSYRWLGTDASGSSLVTAYALVALSGHSYPINYINSPETQPVLGGPSLRLEGPDNTICLTTNVNAVNVLEALTQGSSICNYQYHIQDTAYGPYVDSVNGIGAEDTAGWQYWVNGQPGDRAANDYLISSGDEVLWAYGAWNLQATKISLNHSQINSGESVTVSAQVYNGASWQAWPSAALKINDQSYYVNEQGQSDIVLTSDGVYTIYAPGDETHIRSNKATLTVGHGISQNVDLQVNIQNTSPIPNSVSFSVDQNSLDFGNLAKGQSSNRTLVISNTGSRDLQIESVINGDSVFTNYLKLANESWSDYNLILPQGQNQNLVLTLQLPSDFGQSGAQDGQLIFWGQTQ